MEPSQDLTGTGLSEIWAPFASLTLESWLALIAAEAGIVIFLLIAFWALRLLMSLISDDGDFNDFLLQKSTDNYISMNISDVEGFKSNEAILLKSKRSARIGNRKRTTHGTLYRRRNMVAPGSIELPYKQFNELTGEDDFEEFAENQKTIKVRVAKSSPYKFENLWYHPDLATQIGFRVTVYITVITTIVSILIEYIMG